MSPIKGPDAPTIMRIGAARLTAGLDRMPGLTWKPTATSSVRCPGSPPRN